jgi:hypothetical protein
MGMLAKGLGQNTPPWEFKSLPITKISGDVVMRFLRELV